MKLAFPVIPMDKDDSLPPQLLYISLRSSDNADVYLADVYDNNDDNRGIPVNKNSLDRTFSEALFRWTTEKNLSVVIDCRNTNTRDLLAHEEKVILKGGSCELAAAFASAYVTEDVHEDVHKDIIVVLSGRMHDGRPAQVNGVEQKLKCSKEATADFLFFSQTDFSKVPENDSYRKLDAWWEHWGKKECGFLLASATSTHFTPGAQQHKMRVAALPDSSDWLRALAWGLGVNQPRGALPDLPQSPPGREPESNAGALHERGAARQGVLTGELLLQALPHSANILRQHLNKLPEPYNLPCAPHTLAETALNDEGMLHALFSKSPNASGIRYNHIVIAGPTGTGKTTLAMPLMLNTLMLSRSVVYIAPTRALAVEAHGKFCLLLDKLFELGLRGLPFKKDDVRDRVICSTGEQTEDDWKVGKRHFYAAFCVYEKANLFMNELSIGGGQSIRDNLGMVVADEMHMLGDYARGGILDMFLAKSLYSSEYHSRPANTSLRIVGITTEDVTGNNRGIQRLLTLGGNMKRRTANHSPIVLRTGKRPVPVTHCLLPVEKSSRGVRLLGQPVELTTVRDNESRHLDEEKFINVREQLDKSFCREQKKAGDQKPQLIEVLRKHKRVIIVSSNIEEMQRNAEKLLRLRSRAGDGFVEWSKITPNDKLGTRYCSSESLREIYDALSRGSINQQECERMWTMAQEGIFFYYGRMEQNIRKAMSEAFCTQKELKTSEPLVLFSTSALAFGVNLPADAVVLTYITGGSGNPQADAPLSKNEFHNILGRAGRLGLSDSAGQQKAYIFVSPQEVDSVFSMYRGFDALTAETIKNADMNLFKENCLGSLNDVTFQSFRAIIDGLRFCKLALQQQRIMDLNRILRKTLYWQSIEDYALLSADISLDERDTDKASDEIAKQTNKFERFLTELSEVIYKSSSDSDESLLKVDDGKGREKKYEVTRLAESLIDTGTHWKSVKPMRIWLKHIENFAKAGKDDNVPIKPPVELLLPGLLATEELWTPMRVYCAEVNWNTPPSWGEEHRKWACELLGDELGYLYKACDKPTARKQSDNILRLLGEFLGDPVCRSLELKAGTALSATGRFCIFARLFAALLMWLRGADMDAIQRAYQPIAYKMEGSSMFIPSFSHRFGERASWLAVMCLRFFAESSVHGQKGLLLPHHEQNMQRTTLRLRHGLPNEGIPFFGPEVDLTRKDAVQLLDNGITVARLLAAKEPDKYLLECINAKNLPTTLRQRKQLLKNIHRYFYSASEYFCLSLDPHREWAATSRLMNLLPLGGVWPDYVQHEEDIATKLEQRFDSLISTEDISTKLKERFGSSIDSEDIIVKLKQRFGSLISREDVTAKLKERFGSSINLDDMIVKPEQRFDPSTSMEYIIAELKECFVSLISSSGRRSPRTGNMMEPPTLHVLRTDKGLRLSENAYHLRLVLLDRSNSMSSEEATSTDVLGVVVPWRREKARSPGMEVSFFGGLFLIYCLRRYLSIAETLEWLRRLHSQAGGRALTVHELISGDAALPNVRNEILPEVIREMLIFDEPVALIE